MLWPRRDNGCVEDVPLSSSLDGGNQMSTLRMSRVSGIDIRVHWSFGVALALMTAVFTLGIFARALPGGSLLELWGLGFVSAILFASSILLHELSHSLVARHFGLPVAGITLFMFDGAS